MTSLQSILTHNLKKSQSSAPASVPAETQAVHTQQSTRDRANWLQSLFPAEPQEILKNFANLFSSEKDMQDKALRLKREGKDIRGEVADWSYVNSKHQSLRSKKPVEEPPAPHNEAWKREGYGQQRGSRRARRGRGGRYGRGQWTDSHREEMGKGLPSGDIDLQARPNELKQAVETVAEIHKELLPIAELPMQKVPIPSPSQTLALPEVEPLLPPQEPVQPAQVPIPSQPENTELTPPFRQSNKPIDGHKPFTQKKWVKKVPASQAPPPCIPSELPPVDSHSSLAKVVESKTTNKSQPSAKHQGREVALQAAIAGVDIGVQTEAALIWREGIPCVLVPIAAIEGETMQVTMLGNPQGLFHS